MAGVALLAKSCFAFGFFESKQIGKSNLTKSIWCSVQNPLTIPGKLEMKRLFKGCVSLAVVCLFTATGFSADIVDTAVKAGKFKTLAAALGAADLPIAVNVNIDGVKMNDAKFLATDIDASNGVIHVIDAVLMPPAKTVDLQMIRDRRKRPIAVETDATLQKNEPNQAKCIPKDMPCLAQYPGING